MNESYSILDYLHYLSESDGDDFIRNSCYKYIKNVESICENQERRQKIISLLDRYFTMYGISWILSNWGENHYIGNLKIQKIAFLTNYEEHMSGRYDLGFGEPFLAYHYGPWSLSIQLNIEMLRAFGLLKKREKNESLKVTPKGKWLASSFEDFLNTMPSGQNYISNLSKSSNLISQFDSTQEVLDYVYTRFPVFHDIRDQCILVSSRIDSQIRISNIVLESAKEE